MDSFTTRIGIVWNVSNPDWFLINLALYDTCQNETRLRLFFQTLTPVEIILWKSISVILKAGQMGTATIKLGIVWNVSKMWTYTNDILQYDRCQKGRRVQHIFVRRDTWHNGTREQSILHCMTSVKTRYVYNYIYTMARVKMDIWPSTSVVFIMFQNGLIYNQFLDRISREESGTYRINFVEYHRC